MKDVRCKIYTDLIKSKSEKYTYTNDYEYLKRKGVFKDQDLNIHLKKASFMDRLASNIIGRMFGYATHLIHNYRLHLIEQLTQRYVAIKSENKLLYRRIVSHFYHALINLNSINYKINSFYNINENDICAIQEYVRNNIKINIKKHGESVINRSLELLKLSKNDKIQFQNSKIFHKLMKLISKEEINTDDVFFVFKKFKDAEYIANHNIFSIAQFTKTNNIPNSIKFQLEVIFKNHTTLDQIADDNKLEELFEYEIMQKYNLIIINNLINSHKLSRPTLYPKYIVRDYFSENYLKIAEQALHPLIDWKIFYGYQIISLKEINKIKDNEILIYGIETSVSEKIAITQKMDPLINSNSSQVK